MWKGKWSPCVHHYSSNWKELYTLKLSLEMIREKRDDQIQGSTLFYFTDNSTAYWICNKGSSRNPTLHRLLEDIRSLEVQVGCHLEVIHVPGLIMIQEGTDGLSRGLWVTPWHSSLPRETILEGIFAPLPYNQDLIHHYVTEVLSQFHQEYQEIPFPPGYPGWEAQSWEVPPHLLNLMGRFTVWFPPPELARQIITLLLEAYMEQPLSTAGLLFIPRIVSGCWRGLSKCLRELPTLYPHLTCLANPPLLPIPVTVLYLPCHVRVLKSHGVDSTPAPPGARWHQAQAQELRGLLPRDSRRGTKVKVPLPGHWVPPEWK
jgi:hypothetical protein